MEMTIIEHEMLSAMLCKMKGIEMGQGDLADVPEELTEDEMRVLRYAADLWEVQGVNEKLALVAARLRETPAAERCRCAYEMIMNGCDRTTRTIFAKNAGYISVENYETVLRELAEQEADEAAAYENGLTLDDYAALMQANEAAAAFDESRRREIIEEGKSFYDDRQEDYERALHLADGDDVAYYCRLYELTHFRNLTLEETAADREMENSDLPLQCEIFADFAREEARAEQELLSDYAERYGHFTDEFFYRLGRYAVESAGYISAEQGERQREEAKSRMRLQSLQ